MSDEIYEHLLYDGAKVRGVASFSQAHYDHTIIVHGLAKAYSMTGWRLGFLAAPEPIAKRLTPCKATAPAIRRHSRKRAASKPQRPAGSSADLARGIRQTRRYAHAKLNSIPGLTCVECQGRILLVPEHLEDRPQVRRVLREIVEQERSPPCPASRSARTITSA